MIAKIMEKSPAIYASVMVLTIALSIFCIIGWLYGIFTAAKAGNFGLFVIDLLIHSSWRRAWLGSDLRFLVSAS